MDIRGYEMQVLEYRDRLAAANAECSRVREQLFAETRTACDLVVANERLTAERDAAVAQLAACREAIVLGLDVIVNQASIDRDGMDVVRLMRSALATPSPRCTIGCGGGGADA